MTKCSRSVIRAADLLNEVGVDGLTTRKLAERLGFSTGAYWHFRNKRALLDALAEASWRRITHSVPSRRRRRSFRSGMRSFRRRCSPTAMARIHAGTRPGAPQMNGRRLLLQAGFGRDAVNALMTTATHCWGRRSRRRQRCGERGGTVEQAPPPLLRAMTPSRSRSRSVRAGLAVIVDGLAGSLSGTLKDREG